MADELGFKYDDGKWWLGSYWFTLDGTGVDEVDAILSCVARAGKGSHSTENWEEYGYVGKLQDASNAAATEITSLRAQLEAKGEDSERLDWIYRDSGGTYNIDDGGWTVIAFIKAGPDDWPVDESAWRTAIDAARQSEAGEDEEA